MIFGKGGLMLLLPLSFSIHSNSPSVNRKALEVAQKLRERHK